MRPSVPTFAVLAIVASIGAACSGAPAPVAVENPVSYVAAVPDVHTVSVRGVADVDGTDTEAWRRLISDVVRDTVAAPLLAGQPSWLTGVWFTDRSRPTALSEPALVDTGLPLMTSVRARSVSVGPVVVLAGATGPLAVAEVRIDVEANNGRGTQVEVHRSGTIEMIRTPARTWKIDAWHLAVDRRLGLLGGLGSVWPFSTGVSR